MAIGDQHYCTPKKSQVLGTIGFLEQHHRPYFKSDVFRHFGISESRGWGILHQGRERRHLEETRGCKRLLSPDDLIAIEKIIW